MYKLSPTNTQLVPTTPFTNSRILKYFPSLLLSFTFPDALILLKCSQFRIASMAAHTRRVSLGLSSSGT